MKGDWLVVTEGPAPLIVSIPHAGTNLPSPHDAGFVSVERAQADADWHVEKLYAFAAGLGATVVRTEVSRSIVDVNRDPSGASLYPGQATTGLCPLTGFDEAPLYREGHEPSTGEIEARRIAFFEPYHAALRHQIARLRDAHERVVLYEAHSIRSAVPMFFEGTLPELNIGTNDGKSCAVELADAVENLCVSGGHTSVRNGRFRGGWTTRHYGRPEEGVHAIQMETAMRFYLDEANEWPPRWDEGRAAPAQELLGDILAACIAFAEARA